MFSRLLVLVSLAAVSVAFLTGCPPKGSTWEPSFPETASSGIGPASP